MFWLYRLFRAYPLRQFHALLAQLQIPDSMTFRDDMEVAVAGS